MLFAILTFTYCGIIAISRQRKGVRNRFTTSTMLWIAKLTAYFEEKKEPVLIVMYGDHIPFFSGSVLNALGVEGNDYECQRRQYSVPVLMWSNFNDNKIEFTGENINLNYSRNNSINC